MTPGDRLPRAQLAAAGIGVLVLVLVLASFAWTGSTVRCSPP